MVAPDVIDDHIARLRDAYGDVPVETATTTHSARTWGRVRELHERGVPGAARVWVERDDAALLVRERRAGDRWGVPGGLVEPGEHVDRAGEREVREETGVVCDVVDVVYVHRARRTPADGVEADRDEPIEELAAAFVAEFVEGATRSGAGETAAVDWWESLPDRIRPPTTRLASGRPG
ncbi:MAG: NUDIX domain-containing protein [Halolamina sp.]